MKTKPMVLKMLDLSAAHVTQQTMDWILSEAFDGCSYQLLEYGALVLVDAEKRRLEEIGLEAPDLAACFEYAASLGCTWLKLDRDGEPLSQLKTYDW
jgi:hypothetical protein